MNNPSDKREVKSFTGAVVRCMNEKEARAVLSAFRDLVSDLGYTHMCDNELCDEKDAQSQKLGVYFARAMSLLRPPAREYGDEKVNRYCPSCNASGTDCPHFVAQTGAVQIAAMTGLAMLAGLGRWTDPLDVEVDVDVTDATALAEQKAGTALSAAAGFMTAATVAATVASALIAFAEGELNSSSSALARLDARATVQDQVYRYIWAMAPAGDAPGLMAKHVLQRVFEQQQAAVYESALDKAGACKSAVEEMERQSRSSHLMSLVAALAAAGYRWTTTTSGTVR